MQQLTRLNYDYETTEFSKSLMAGVFAGITATVLALIYNTLFRDVIGFQLSDMINVSTIIFSVILLLTIAGLIFYVFHHYFKQGTVIFQVAAILLTVVLVMAVMSVQRSADPLIAIEFRELLTGIICITGACTVFIIPYLYKHDIV